MHNKAYGKSERSVNAAHVLAVAAGKVIVNGNNMYAFAGKGIQISRQGCNKGFAFACTHFGNFAAVQNNAAYKLYIKMAHAGNTARSFAHNGKCFRQDIIKRFSFGKAQFKLAGFGSKIC